MADPNEHRPAPRSPGSGPHSPGSGEVEPVEAELVEPPHEPLNPTPAPAAGAGPPAGSASSTTEDEEHRQYQEFLEFQRFKRWQREQGGQPGDLAAPPPAAPPAAPATAPRRPWWKRALRLFRFKLVRRLVYLVLLILLVPPMLQHFLTGSSGSVGGGGGGGVPADSVPITATNPQRAVAGVYNYLRGDQPERTCLMFTPSGKAAFASEHGAQDCASAARQLHGEVTAPGQYANPSLAENAVETAGPEAVVHGCRVRSGGGPELGSFGLARADDGGWLIDSYDRDDPACR